MKPPEHDPFETLNIRPIASSPSSISADQLKQAYLTACKNHHPDRPSGNPAQFKRVHEAYEYLKDDKVRRELHLRLSSGGSYQSCRNQQNTIRNGGGYYSSAQRPRYPSPHYTSATAGPRVNPADMRSKNITFLSVALLMTITMFSVSQMAASWRFRRRQGQYDKINDDEDAIFTRRQLDEIKLSQQKRRRDRFTVDSQND